MRKQEHKEESVVTSADTLIDPNTMMIELLHTHVAHRAMLRSSWFDEMASFAFGASIE